MTSFFHAYDLRGTYPDEIGEEEAIKVGKAYGSFIDSEEVLVGRDGRKHGEEITEAFIDGIISTGTDVVFAGMVPTPVVYFGQVENNFGSAAVVTASHNPPEYTGFKFNLEGARAMSREGGMKGIEEIYESEEFDSGQGKRRKIKLIDDYIQAVANKLEESELDLIVNCGNGVTGVMARKMFERLGCSVKVVNEEVDGSFPNHLADPGSEEAKQLTKDLMSDEDLGVIFDGDGDRAGFLIPGHGYVEEDKVIALFSEESLAKENGKVVYDLRVSKLVPEKVEEYGGQPQEMRVGHTFISERIHSSKNVVFAGELSGHFYFPLYGFPWDDALFAASLMARICDKKEVAEKLDSYPDYPVSPEINIDCPHEAKEKVIQEIAQQYSDYKLSTKDGVKIHFDSGWVLVRPSSTEPKVRLRCEADTEEELDRILGKVEPKVRETVSKYQ